MIRYLFLLFFLYWGIEFYTPATFLPQAMFYMLFILLLSVVFKAFLYSYNLKDKLSLRVWLLENLKSNLVMLIIGVPFVWFITAWAGFIIDPFNRVHDSIPIIGFFTHSYHAKECAKPLDRLISVTLIIWFPLYAYVGAFLDYNIISKKIGKDKKLYNLSFYLNWAFYIALIFLPFILLSL